MTKKTITLNGAIYIDSGYFGSFYGNYCVPNVAINSNNLYGLLSARGLTAQQIATAKYWMVICSYDTDFANNFNGSRLCDSYNQLKSTGYYASDSEISFDITSIINSTSGSLDNFWLYPPFEDGGGDAFAFIGEISLAVTYEEDAVPTITSLYISQEPYKMSYEDGDYFDAYGMIVRAQYNDGTVKTITDYTLSSPVGALTIGEHYITVRKDNISFTNNQKVKVVKKLTALELRYKPFRTEYYVSETFNAEGLVVFAKYSDGSENELLPADYTITGGGQFTTAGTKTITISYKTRTAALSITVKSFANEPASESESFKRDLKSGSQPELTNECASGKSSINLLSGRLLYENTDTKADSDIQISHVFNSRLNNRVIDTRFKNAGKNWKLNIQQALINVTNSSYYEADVKYIYIDALGIEHELIEAGIDNYNQIVYYARGNFSLKMANNVITDANKNKYHFNESGLLFKITNYLNKELTIRYGDNFRINSVTDTNDKTFIFEYNFNTGVLKSITADDGNVTVFNYGEGTFCRWLTSIVYSGVETVTFEYTQNSFSAGAVPYLSSVTDNSGYKLNFTYSGEGAERKAETFYETTVYSKITKDSVTNGNTLGGKRTNIFYLDQKNTVVKNEKDIYFRYVFDDDKNVTDSYEEKASLVNIFLGITKRPKDQGPKTTTSAKIKFYSKSSYKCLYSVEDVNWIGFFDNNNIRGTYGLNQGEKFTANDLLYILSQQKDCNKINISLNNCSFVYKYGTDVTVSLGKGDEEEILYLFDIGVTSVVETLIDGKAKTETYTLEEYDNGKVLKHITNYLTNTYNTKMFTAYSHYDNSNRVIKTVDFYETATEYNYDTNGKVSSTKTYSIHDPSNAITQQCRYDNSGRLIEETDDRGYSDDGKQTKTVYAYNQQNGLLNSLTMPNSASVNYNFNPRGNVLNSISAVSDSKENQNSFNYNKGLLTTATHNNTNYDFEYNGLGDVTDVSVAGKKILTRAVNKQAIGDDVKNTYYNASNEEIKRYYDNRGRLLRETRKENNKEVDKVKCTYITETENEEQAGYLKECVDEYAGLVYTYQYDLQNKSVITTVKNTSGGFEWLSNCKLDDSNRFVNGYYNIDPQLMSYNYTYTDSQNISNPRAIIDFEDNRLYNEELTRKFNVNYSYNGIGQRSEKTFKCMDSSSQFSDAYFNYKETYGYAGAKDATGKITGTTNYIGSVRNTLNGTVQYKYDASGNITSVSKDSVVQATYTYDKLNRIASEVSGGTTTTYTYDAGGNILEKKVSGVAKKYTYQTSGWRDQLTSYDGKTVSSYDQMGNPRSYLGATLAWSRGHILDTYTKGTTTGTYTYDASGMRVKKSVKIGSTITETKYTNIGGRIMRETVGTEKIIYYYDSDGVCGFNYKGVNYYYVKNIQGDIIAVYDFNFTKKAAYTYDAFGNHTIDLNIDNIATVNPFRYRGYYYDTETKLFYVTSRYYDPETGRFINADNICVAVSLGAGIINGLNLYAYCYNDPVMLSDSTGCSPFWDAIGGWFKDHWKELVIGAAFIIVGAVVTALTAGTGVGFMAAFGSALLSSMTQVGISVAISAGIGALVGGITGGWEGALQGFGNGIASGFMWGGIFAGGAQILSGGFKAMAQLGANTSKSGSFLKVLTPNRLRSAGEVAKIAQKGQAYYEYGGTLLKVGKVFIDVSNKTFLHMHLFTAAHLPLGTVLAGILGGF